MNNSLEHLQSQVSTSNPAEMQGRKCYRCITASASGSFSWSNCRKPWAAFDKSRSVETPDKGELVSSPISQKTEFLLYPQTLKIKRAFYGETPIPPVRSGLGLQGFSDKSRGRLRFTAANSGHILKSQFCCTYQNKVPADGRQFKKHLNAFLTRCRQEFPFLSYLWIGEFQTRGVPHAHVFFDLAANDSNRIRLAQIWSRIADRGNETLLAFHSHPKNMIPWSMGSGSYLCKYLDKQHQKAIPAGFYNFGRWWGNSRGLVPEPEVTDTDTLKADFPEVDETTGECHDAPAIAVLVRTVGRYHEHINKRSFFRSTSKSTSALTGAPIFRQMLNHLYRTRNVKPPEAVPF